jgi:WD repeat-containing protein 55
LFTNVPLSMFLAGLFTASSDRSVKCLDAAGNVTWSAVNGHESAVNTVTFLAETLIATGDEDGCIKIWDTRASPLAGAASAGGAAAGASAASAAAAPTVSFSKQNDVITDLMCVAEKATLLATSGDGTLASYDLRKMKINGRSRKSEDEMLSMCLLKGGNAVVTGTQEGVLLVWKWGRWNTQAPDWDEYLDAPERFRGHPQSIDALLAVDDDTIITGSSDGLIRLLTIKPNKLVGILGEHSDFPIECLAWSRDKRLLASASHDNTVKFWDTGYLFDEDDDEDEGATAGGKKKGSAKAAGGASKFTSLPELALPHAEDTDDEDEDDDEDSEDDDEGLMDEDEEDDEEDDEPMAGAGAGGAKGRGAGGKAKGKASAAMDDDDDDDDDEDEAPRGKGKSKSKAASSKKGAAGKKGGKKGGGGGAGGFFNDL